MVSMFNFVYLFKESLRGFTRNLSTAIGSIVTIFLSLVLIGLFFVSGMIVEKTIKSVEEQVNITLYVADNADPNRISELSNKISAMNGVGSVGFTTKEQALENFKNTMSSNPEIIEQLDGANPLPASIDVELSDVQLVNEIAANISSNTIFLEICDRPEDPAQSIKYGQETVDRLLSITNAIRYIGMALVVLLIFIALVFINNTIRLAILARRKEIAIMRLVGASNGFISGPFLMEGALHSLIGSAFAVLSIELIRNLVLPSISDTITWLPLSLEMSSYLLIYLGLVLAGLLIGIVGSMLAMRRYLKI